MTGMDTGEVDPRTQAALDLAGTHVFGTEPGRIPAVLFEAYEASDAHLDRALLGAALARCWVYARERHRAVPFAVAAVRDAEATGRPGVLADALDAALTTHWGPDELDVRVDLFVERDSQKAIVIGKGGARLRDVGTRARREIEALLGARVFLDLHVRVAKDWQRDPKQLGRLGF